MLADYAVNLDFWDKIQPRIRQWEITHQRPMPKQQYQALVEAELGAASKTAEDRFFRGKALDLEQQRFDLSKEAQDAANRAAKVRGVTDLASTAGVGYLGYKQIGVMERNAAANEALVKGITGAGGAQAATPAAIELGQISPGAFAAPTAESAGFTLGGQAALAKTTPSLAVQTSFAETAPVAAEASGGTAAADVGAETAGATFGGAILAGTAGYAAGYLASRALGANEDISQGLQLGGAGAALGGYLAAGTTIGGPVGAVIGLIIGVTVSLFDDSVVCSELLRQGRISGKERAMCVVFKNRYVPDDMFLAYQRWAKPHVEAMRRGGWRNRVRLPFAHAFVGYMVNTVQRKKCSWFERVVFNFAWGMGRFIVGNSHGKMEAPTHA